MRFKNIRLCFYIALVTVAFVRLLQFFHSIDSVTGFIKPEYELIGYGLLILTFLIAFSVMGISFFIRRCPVKMPRINIFAGSSALILAFSILYDLTSLKASANIPEWQILLLKITGVLAAVFFMMLFVKSLKKIKNFSIQPICFIAPVIYYLARLVYIFTASSVIALISDNLLSLICCIFTVLFMFEFCLIKMKQNSDTSYKKIAATGFTAVILSVATAFPQIVAVLYHTPSAQRVIFSDALLTFFTGVFIYFFLRNYFSGKNLKKYKRRHHISKHTTVGETVDDFYMG